jgi:hypothetical protein
MSEIKLQKKYNDLPERAGILRRAFKNQSVAVQGVREASKEFWPHLFPNKTKATTVKALLLGGAILSAIKDPKLFLGVAALNTVVFLLMSHIPASARDFRLEAAFGFACKSQLKKDAVKTKNKMESSLKRLEEILDKAGYMQYARDVSVRRDAKNIARTMSLLSNHIIIADEYEDLYKRILGAARNIDPELSKTLKSQYPLHGIEPDFV